MAVFASRHASGWVELGVAAASLLSNKITVLSTVVRLRVFSADSTPSDSTTLSFKSFIIIMILLNEYLQAIIHLLFTTLTADNDQM